MLQPLDPRMLEALSCEGDGDEKLDFDPHNYIGGIRAHIKEGKDWAMGVWGLLMEGGQFKTLLECTKDPWYYGRMGYNDWRIIFYVIPLFPRKQVRPLILHSGPSIPRPHRSPELRRCHPGLCLREACAVFQNYRMSQKLASFALVDLGIWQEI